MTEPSPTTQPESDQQQGHLAMTKEELAAALNGREYGSEITKPEEKAAKDARLVVVFGYSDDNMALRGAVDDEVSCYDGGEALFSAMGLVQNECDSGDDCPNWSDGQYAKVEAVWDEHGYSWTYETAIPHATFDIVEDGEKYCRGIVFSLGDVYVATGDALARRTE